MSKPNLILISGKKQSGKDTVGKYLSDNHSYNIMSFAEILKDNASSFFRLLLNISIDDPTFSTEKFKQKIIPWTFNKKQKTYREFLQVFGTEWMRNFFNDELWAEILAENIRNKIYIQNKLSHDIVVTDFRFPNEYTTIFENLKDVYKICSVRINRDSGIKKDEHISETALDKGFDFDATIDNNCSLAELFNKVEILLPNVQGE